MSDKKNSRFFMGGDDSSSSSSSGSDSDRDEAPTAGGAGRPPPRRYESDSDSDDGGRKRNARSVKARVFDSIAEVVKAMLNQLKIGNWVGVSDRYDELNKVTERNAVVLNKEVCIAVAYLCAVDDPLRDRSDGANLRAFVWESGLSGDV